MIIDLNSSEYDEYVKMRNNRMYLSSDDNFDYMDGIEVAEVNEVDSSVNCVTELNIRPEPRKGRKIDNNNLSKISSNTSPPQSTSTIKDG